MADSLLGNLNLSGMSKGQKIAIVVGGVAVAGLAFYEIKHKSSSGTSSNTTTGNAATPQTVTDPTTGETYPADGIDPADGMTYAEEIDQYGSIEAAEEAYGQNVSGYTSPSSTSQSAAQGQSAAYGSNAAWSQAVTSGLTDLGYSSEDVAQALGLYLDAQPLGTLADGTSAYSLVQTALAEYGPPPSGTYALIQPSATQTSTPAPVTVPNVVGRTDLDTAEGIIAQAGLSPASRGDSGTGNKGSVTAQSPVAGSKVSKGSTVILTYTVPVKK